MVGTSRAHLDAVSPPGRLGRSPGGRGDVRRAAGLARRTGAGPARGRGGGADRPAGADVRRADRARPGAARGGSGHRAGPRPPAPRNS